MIQYPMSSLRLSVPTTTRAASPGAPTCDPKRKLKNWIDTNPMVDSQGMVSYFFFEQQPDLSWVQIQRKMSLSEATSLNLEGVQKYPEYVVSPTSVATAAGAPLNPQNLSNPQDAAALLNALNSAGYQCTLSQDLFTVNPTSWGSETRRLWIIIPSNGGKALSAGGLLFMMNANGVGAPGHWTIVGGEPTWKSDAPVDPPTSTLGAWDIPVRQMTSDERIGPVGPLGGAPMIQHAPFDDGTAINTGGGLTAAQAAQLNHVEAMLSALCTMFRVTV